MLASWIMRFQQSEIRTKTSVNAFTVNSDAARPEMTTSASASDVTEGVSNTPRQQIITNIPGTASVNMMSGLSVVSRASSVSTAEPSRQTRAETAAGPVRSTAGETIIEKVKIHTLPGTENAERQETTETTVTTCTEIQESADVETLINTAQKTPEPERISESDIIQTHTSETEVTIFEKPAEISITPKPESETSRFPRTITATVNIRSATPIPEPGTVRATNFIKNFITTRPDITFRTESVRTETKADLTEGKLAPTTIIKRPKTAATGPSKVETSEKNTVRPQKSPHAIKTSNGPTINEATGINLITMIQTATGKQAKTLRKQLSTAGTDITINPNVLTISKSTVNHLNTISPERQTAKVFEKLTTRSHKSVSPCTDKCQTKSPTNNTTGRRGLSDKTFYSAITMGCILVVCGLLALVVFIKDFIVSD
ncbi:mucin-5AC-like [Carassius auratus]|uniref:Mucin-5AC-like n=1 Tax=Carassius auratus TaxID=7957 RepID=A0A6P6K9H4_CARAU|nr:mucin-5AC-like [Carassius auratus]